MLSIICPVDSRLFLIDLISQNNVRSVIESSISIDSFGIKKLADLVSYVENVGQNINVYVNTEIGRTIYLISYLKLNLEPIKKN